jgi:circadian clock protein KaiC
MRGEEVQPRSPVRDTPGSLPKAPTGITGLDEVTLGGLPRGRPTLLCGAAGCGKTLLALCFLVNGAASYGEPGVFVSFEETGEDLALNVASLGIDLPGLEAEGLLAVDHVRAEQSEIEEAGEFDLDGLFIRLGYAIDSVGAKRVVLDTIESLFAAMPNERILRAELRRLFRWLKDKGVTAVITAERGEKSLTRQGLEEYVSDCVILLDNRVERQVVTRRLTIVKYRGSAHGTDEYPFLIDAGGVTVMPLTSVSLDYPVSSERVPSGIPALDAMLGGKGYFRGSTVLLSGTAGAGKTSIAAHFADAACARGERCLYFAFEESPAQILRNMKSIGIDLAKWSKRDLLRFEAARPTAYGLETHLATIHRAVHDFAPSVVILDPLTNFLTVSSPAEVKSMLMRLMDYLKRRQITGLLTNLTPGSAASDATDVGISSLTDTWVQLRAIEHDGERDRSLQVLKARGIAQSSQVRELVITSHGVDLVDVVVGPEGVLTGSARRGEEARRAEALVQQQQRGRVEQMELEAKRRLMELQVAALQAEFAAAEARFKAERQNTDDLQQISEAGLGRAAAERLGGAGKQARRRSGSES